MRMAGISGLFFVIGIGGAQATNFEAANDRIYTIPISNTASETWPAGTDLTATSSLPNSLTVSIGGSNSAVTLSMTPKVQVSPGIIVTISGNGVVTQTLTVDIINDPISPLVLNINQSAATNILQPVPTAPGP